MSCCLYSARRSNPNACAAWRNAASGDGWVSEENKHRVGRASSFSSSQSAKSPSSPTRSSSRSSSEPLSDILVVKSRARGLLETVRGSVSSAIPTRRYVLPPPPTLLFSDHDRVPQVARAAKCRSASLVNFGRKFRRALVHCSRHGAEGLRRVAHSPDRADMASTPVKRKIKLRAQDFEVRAAEPPRLSRSPPDLAIARRETGARGRRWRGGAG